MTEEVETQELIELVSERNLDKTVEELIRIQERFSVWGHGVGHDIHGEEKAKKEVEEGYKTPWGGRFLLRISYLSLKIWNIEKIKLPIS